MRVRVLLTVAFMMLAGSAFAHVSIRPREAKAGATDTYTVRVPTEGSTATIVVVIEIPSGVTVTSVAGAPDTHEETRANGVVTSIRWKVNIAPGDAQEFTFVATIPAKTGDLTWKAHQGFADGTFSDWVEAPSGRRPAPITKVATQP